MGQIDYAGINQAIMPRALEFLQSWVPGGKVRGREYTAASIAGGDQSKSFSVNLNTGVWSDFAIGGDMKGPDLISLWAKIKSIKMGDAARECANMIGYTMPENGSAIQTQTRKEPEPEIVFGKPAGNAPEPNFKLHGQHPSMVWPYLDSDGSLMFYVVRYERDGSKDIRPWSWAPGEWEWMCKAWPSPRPLYGLDLLAKRPEAPVMIVEGEKACDAARKLWTAYVVVTWMGGTGGVGSADFKPLHGRKILCWPDADEPGARAMQTIMRKLSPHCPEIKYIDTQSKPVGWDIADAVSEGISYADLKAWAISNLKVYGTHGLVASEAVQAASPPEAKPVEVVATAVSGDEKTLNVAQASATTPIPDEAAGNPTLFALWEQLGLVLSASGAPACNMGNAVQVIKRTPELRGAIWFDTFHQRCFTTWGGQGVRPWSDADSRRLTIIMTQEMGLTRMSSAIIHEAVQAYGEANAKNEPRDWMESLTWDGTSRIDTFLETCYGAKPTEYTRAISKNFWVGMVKRIYEPGCKLDNLLVLQGKQGVFKSTSVEIIGGKWYAETKESVRTNDFFMILAGKMLVEIADLASFQGADQARLKSVITSRIDRYRAPYGRTAEDYLRQSIFVGTTNEDKPLKDPTGGRRYWPVKCGKIDLAKIREQRDQCFAEAVSRMKAGENWWVVPIKAAQAEQEECRETDEWESVVGIYLATVANGATSVHTIATECLKIDIGKLDLNLQRRISNVLRHHGWESRADSIAGKTVRGWYPAAEQNGHAEAVPDPFIEEPSF